MVAPGGLRFRYVGPSQIAQRPSKRSRARGGAVSAAFEQAAGASVSAVNVLDTPLPEALHHRRHAVVPHRGHQHVGMHGDRLLGRHRCKRLQEERPIRFVEEHRGTIDPTQDHVHRIASGDDTGAP